MSTRPPTTPQLFEEALFLAVIKLCIAATHHTCSPVRHPPHAAFCEHNHPLPPPPLCSRGSSLRRGPCQGKGKPMPRLASALLAIYRVPLWARLGCAKADAGSAPPWGTKVQRPPPPRTTALASSCGTAAQGGGGTGRLGGLLPPAGCGQRCQQRGWLRKNEVMRNGPLHPALLAGRTQVPWGTDAPPHPFLTHRSPPRSALPAHPTHLCIVHSPLALLVYLGHHLARHLDGGAARHDLRTGLGSGLRLRVRVRVRSSIACQLDGGAARHDLRTGLGSGLGLRVRVRVRSSIACHLDGGDARHDLRTLFFLTQM